MVLGDIEGNMGGRMSNAMSQRQKLFISVVFVIVNRVSSYF